MQIGSFTQMTPGDYVRQARAGVEAAATGQTSDSQQSGGDKKALPSDMVRPARTSTSAGVGQIIDTTV